MNKWTEFAEQVNVLNSNKFKFSIICIQEVWNVPCGVKYDLPGYKPFHFTIRDSSGFNGNSGGGVGLWVNEEFDFEPLENISIFEKKHF